MTVSKPVRRAQRNGKRERGTWPNIIRPAAAAIVRSYSTGVTLRQLFYRLVSLPHDHPARLANTMNEYTALALNTADWRREGIFPDLVDQTRSIAVVPHWDSPKDVIAAAAAGYRRDHTEGQEYQIWLGTEKSGLVNQLKSWFGERGLPIISLGGYASQGYVDQIVRRVDADGRPAILLYAGDHDPTGWSILQNFVDRADCWSNPELRGFNPNVMPRHRGYKAGHAGKRGTVPNFDRYRKYKIALTPEQCIKYDLPRSFAKEKDNNLNAFELNFVNTLTAEERRAGRGVQIEVDALEPSTLQTLFTTHVEKYWDTGAYEAVLQAEDDDRERLDKIIKYAGRMK